MERADLLAIRRRVPVAVRHRIRKAAARALAAGGKTEGSAAMLAVLWAQAEGLIEKQPDDLLEEWVVDELVRRRTERRQ
jgi:hypothetical protein